MSVQNQTSFFLYFFINLIVIIIIITTVFDVRRTQPKLDTGVAAWAWTLCEKKLDLWTGGLGTGYGNTSQTLDVQHMTSLSRPKAPVSRVVKFRMGEVPCLKKQSFSQRVNANP